METYLERLHIDTKGLGIEKKVLMNKLTDQKINPDDEYISGQKGYEIAYGWCIIHYVQMNPNKSWHQGDKGETRDYSDMINLARYYFFKHGENFPLGESPKIIYAGNRW